MRHLRNKDGFIKPLLTIAVLIAVGYAGYQFAMPYYKYSAFKSEVKEIALLGLGDAGKVRAEVYQSAKSFNLPLEEDDIIVTKLEHTVRVQTSWSTTIDLLGLYQKTLDFTVDIED
ncbi:MAG: hypothetical protein M1497_01285 [Nitrospirae bacterium]|nr:hypothetical protein [Nitrospirota bacterium]